MNLNLMNSIIHAYTTCNGAELISGFQKCLIKEISRNYTDTLFRRSLPTKTVYTNSFITLLVISLPRRNMC